MKKYICDRCDVEITLPPATMLPEGYQFVVKCKKDVTVTITQSDLDDVSTGGNTGQFHCPNRRGCVDYIHWRTK